MGYKVLGFIVWQGGKLYFRRRMNGSTRKVAIGGALGALAIGGLAVAAQRQSAD